MNKPAGRTSFTLVAQLRRLLGVRKIGHAGTLDPFATGLMVMLVGRKYTRLSDSLLTEDKEYVAQAKLGVTTDSYDLDGTIIAESDQVVNLEQVQEVIAKFQGDILQTPPMFSAKKIGGKKLCDLARKGVEVERKPVPVRVEIELIHFSFPTLTFRVACSKGTYIRSLAHDIGQALGCGAHLTHLHRTLSGQFNVADAIDAEGLEAEQALARLISV